MSLHTSMSVVTVNKITCTEYCTVQYSNFVVNAKRDKNALSGRNK